ncbi:MAG: SDR family oxidoreductase [Bdellovibrionota bacterium]
MGNLIYRGAGFVSRELAAGGVMADIFSGKWVLITGASMGLGAEFAKQLAAKKANLILTARSREKLEELAGSLSKQYGVQTKVIALDLGAPGGAEKLCREVDALGIEVEHLVSNAGYGDLTEFIACDPAWEAGMVRLNCEALVSLSRHFLPGMVKRGRGGVIHLASVAGFQPAPYMSTYAATKAFVLNFSAALSEEVRSSGVRVMALCPGPVPTGFQKAAGIALQSADRLAVLSAEETVRRGLKAYESRWDVKVPGLANFLGTLGVKFAPRWFVVRALSRLMGESLEASRRAGVARRAA